MRINIFLIVIIAISIMPGYSKAAVQIFACEPEWASLSHEIGGDKVAVFSATSSRQDPHYIRAKPSLIARMRKSDLVIGSGASLEIGWLPILLRKAGNSRIQPGELGYLMAADVVDTLDKPMTLDRSQGDVHPEGNPHIHLNPYNITLVAKAVTDRLVQLDQKNIDHYRRRQAIFLKKWIEAIKRWELELGLFKDLPVVVHHTSFAYLENWLGLRRIATLEPKPGIPPTTGHLRSLLTAIRKKQPQLILRTPYDSAKASTWLSGKSSLRAVKLPYTVGGDEKSDNLFSLFDQTLLLLKGALHDK